MANKRMYRQSFWERSLPGWIFYLVIIVVAFLAFLNLQKGNQLSNTYNLLGAQQVDLNTKLVNLKDNQTLTKFVVSPNGQISKNGLTTLNVASKVFTLATTFKSADEYHDNQVKAKKYVSDLSLFSGNAFFGKNTDLLAFRVKEKTQQVDSYQLDKNHFLTVVRFVAYHDQSDLDDADILKSNYAAFISTGAGGELVTVKQIPDFTSPTGFQGVN